MNSADPSHRIQPELRAAISAFVNDARAASKQLALSEAVAAIRQAFPDLVVSDADLADALASEALTAGLDVEFDVLKTPKALERRALAPQDNEGGPDGEEELGLVSQRPGGPSQ